MYKPLLFQRAHSEPVDVFLRKACTFWNTSGFSCGRTGMCASRCNALCSDVLFAHPSCAATWRTWSDESKTNSGVECCHGVLGFLGLSFPLQREKFKTRVFKVSVVFCWHRRHHIFTVDVQEKSLTYHALFLIRMIWRFTLRCFSQHTGKPSVFSLHPARVEPHKSSSCGNWLEMWFSAQSSSLAAAAVGLPEVASVVPSLTRKVPKEGQRTALPS